VFTQKLVAAAEALSLGNGLTDGVDLGPLVNARAVQDVDALVQATVEAGALIACGGSPSETFKKSRLSVLFILLTDGFMRTPLQFARRCKKEPMQS